MRRMLIAIVIIARCGLAYSQDVQTKSSSKTYSLIGQMDMDPETYQAYVPTTLMGFLDSSLMAPRGMWFVEHQFHWGSKYSEVTSDIVMITDTKAKNLVFVIKKGEWTLVNTRGDFVQISTVLKNEFRLGLSPETLLRMDNQRWNYYFQSLTYLFAGKPQRICLTEDQKSLLESPQFKSLCQKPTIANNQGSTSVSENVLTSTGSVEEWCVTFKGPLLDISNIEVKILLPDKTFPYIAPPSV